MTPKEKSEELIIKYVKLYNHFDGEYEIEDRIIYTRKNAYHIGVFARFALIAVDEIIHTLNYDIRDLDVRGNVLLDLIEYWRQVKQEIEML